MTKEQLYEYIEQYLEGNLSEEDLKIFQQKMEQDEAFANEVKLHERLHQELSNTGKKELVNTLTTIRSKYQVEQTQGSRIKLRNILSIAAVVLLIFVTFWFFVLRNPSSATGPDQQKVVQDENIDPPAILDSNQTPEIDMEGLAETANEDKAEDMRKDKILDPDASKQNESNFASNQFFEELIEGSKNEQLDFNFENQKLSSVDGSSPVKLSGSVRSSQTLEEGDYLILVFNNLSQNVQEDQALIVSDFSLEKDQDEDVTGFGAKPAYNFDFQSEEKLQSGLYYFIIVDKKDGNQVYANKVRIEK